MAFTKQETDGVVTFTADCFTAAGGVSHGFSTRLGGVSTGTLTSLNLGRSRDDVPACVEENHRRFAVATGSAGPLVLCRQIHSNLVRAVTERDALTHLYDGDNFEADGLVTDTPGLRLMIFYADCIPVLLYDPRKRAIGAVHSGWRGTAGAIVRRAVEAMGKHYGSRPEDILAAIGPGIGPECFETHRDVPDAMEEQLGKDFLLPYVQALPAGKYLVDLKGIIARQLGEAGLGAERIATLPLCTACHLDLFWSHRRLGERRGNQAAVIALSAR